MGGDRVTNADDPALSDAQRGALTRERWMRAQSVSRGWWVRYGSPSGLVEYLGPDSAHLLANAYLAADPSPPPGDPLPNRSTGGERMDRPPLSDAQSAALKDAGYGYLDEARGYWIRESTLSPAEASIEADRLIRREVLWADLERIVAQLRTA
jgi:hypothetical protein